MNQKQWIIIGVVGVLVILAIVLGVVFGTQNSGGSSSAGTAAPPPTPVAAAPTPTAEPTSEVRGFLGAVALDGGAEFADETSYHFKALSYMEDLGRGFFTDEQLSQRYALACIIFATNSVSTIYSEDAYEGVIPTWTNSDLWLTAADECTWFGITCDAEGRVTAIELDDNGLTGSFPNEVTLLKDSLGYLNLQDNIIFNEGDAGLEWLSSLTTLSQLYFGGCYFAYDGVPPFLSKLSNLIGLDISYTLMHGNMRPETFSTMTSLAYLEMGGNSYGTSIPPEIATLPLLRHFYVGNADITGDLSFMDSIGSLEELWVDENPALGGSIPDSIGRHTDMLTLSFTACNFTGTLPTQMGLLSNITKIWIYGNAMTGTIPTEIAQLGKLEDLYVDDNEFMGDMPEEICLLRDTGGVLETLTSDCANATEGLGGPEVTCGCCTCCEDCS